MKDDQPKTFRRQDYRPPNYLIERTDLRFELAEDHTLVRADLALKRHAGQSAAALHLDGRELELVSVSVDGRALSGNEYQVDDDGLTIHEIPDECTVSCVTRIQPQNNTSLEGLYRSGGMFCTQCEAQGFRKITYYLDRPDVMSRFTTTIVADGERYPHLLSNGNEVARRVLADGRTEVVWEDPFPKPSYLFALVAGDLAMIEDEFVTQSGRRVTLRIYSEPHNIGQCDFAMGALQRAMRWDEERFGREYDLDIFMIVAVESFNMGAMENKGLNVFNTSCVLAHPDTATDAAFQRVEAVVAHEYFHNWSGNRVTCRDWFQLSLKEGFTVFRDAEFSSDMGSRTVKRVEDVNKLRMLQFAEDGGPMAHPVRPESFIEISNFYTTTVYEKGAEVVRMLQTLLGQDGFRKGSDLYFERHDGQAVTCEDFVLAMEAANEVDLDQFRRWYAQAGTPRVTIEPRFDAQANQLTVTVSQQVPATPGQPSKAPMHIPFAVGLLARDGREMLGETGTRNGFAVRVSGGVAENPDSDGTLILHLREREHRFVFDGITEQPVMSVLRGFSAPLKLQFERPLDELTFLMAHDTDGFSRWDAAQSYYMGCIAELLAGRTLPDDALAIAGELLELAKSAPDDGERKALLAMMLALPTLALLVEQFDPVRIDALHHAREQLATRLAHEQRQALLDIYRANAAHGPYEPNAVGIARRSLKNLCLGYLGRLDDPEMLALIKDQFDTADNMTDRAAALRCLVEYPFARGETARAEALEIFYQRFKNEALVMDMWLSAQAASNLRGGLQRVQALESHPAFNDKNPNKVRALYGAFAGAALVNFHADDGSGYQFLVDRVIRMDAINPQVASRLAKQMSNWRRFEPTRRQLMQRELQRLAAQPKLSPDVYEVVTKALAEE